MTKRGFKAWYDEYFEKRRMESERDLPSARQAILDAEINCARHKVRAMLAARLVVKGRS